MPDPLVSKRILVHGLGVEGRSTVRYLSKIGVTHLAATDAKSLAELAPEAREVLDRTGADFFVESELPDRIGDFDLVVKSPGVRASTVPGLDRARRMTSATQIFCDRCPGRILAITGSKGKSTTAMAAYRFLRASGVPTHLGGNIGEILAGESKPLLATLDEIAPSPSGGGMGRGSSGDALSPSEPESPADDPPPSPLPKGGGTNSSSTPSHHVWVCELSSYQLETLDFAPDVAVLTSLFPEHLDQHGGWDAYLAAKLRIFAGQREGQLALVSPQAAEVLRSGVACNADRSEAPTPQIVPDPGSSLRIGGRTLDVSACPLPGAHQAMNVQLAIDAALTFGASEDAIIAEIPRLAALPHRLQMIGEIRGVEFWDDSIGTNPPAAIAAIRALTEIRRPERGEAESKDLVRAEGEGASHPDLSTSLRSARDDGQIGAILLGGGDPKGGEDFLALAREIVQARIGAVVLFSGSREEIRSALREAGFSGDILMTDSMTEAASWAMNRSEPGRAVLLSPAATSFRGWRSYADRGDDFIRAVRELGAREG